MTTRPSSAPAEVPLLKGIIQHVSRRVPIVAPEDRARDIRTSLIGKSFDSAVSLAVCRDDVLVGMLRVEDLLSAPDGATAAALMDDSLRR